MFLPIKGAKILDVKAAKQNMFVYNVFGNKKNIHWKLYYFCSSFLILFKLFLIFAFLKFTKELKVNVKKMIKVSNIFTQL